MRKILLFISFAILLAISLSSVAQDVTLHNKPILRFIKVDSFRPKADPADPPEWVVKFSKFRAINFLVNSEADGKDDSQSWLKVIDTSKYASELMLPPNLDNDVRRFEKYILGLRARFMKPDYHWIILEPSYTRAAGRQLGENNKPIETETARHIYDPANPRYAKEKQPFIQMPGITKELRLWVWSSNVHYKLEVQVEDFNGQLYHLPMGDLTHIGWKMLKVKIPEWIPQISTGTPFIKPIRIVRFKMYTDAHNKNVNDFYVYFSYLNGLIDVSKGLYKGFNLEKKSNEIWNIK